MLLELAQDLSANTAASGNAWLRKPFPPGEQREEGEWQRYRQPEQPRQPARAAHRRGVRGQRRLLGRGVASDVHAVRERRPRGTRGAGLLRSEPGQSKCAQDTRTDDRELSGNGRL